MNAGTDEVLTGPVPLERRHKTAAFRSGTPELDICLKRYALTNQRRGGGRTYVALRGKQVVSYHTLSASAATCADAPEAVTAGLGRYPVPVIRLARLAVDERERGRGLGAAMLKDAFQRSLAAADIIGARAILTHAKSEEARRFYERFGFMSSPSNALHLFLVLETLRQA